MTDELLSCVDDIDEYERKQISFILYQSINAHYPRPYITHSVETTK